jgi:sugar-specific transcriptional regulator TrmB/DNA-binding CsgD family transcriptional regulator
MMVSDKVIGELCVRVYRECLSSGSYDAETLKQQLSLGDQEVERVRIELLRLQLLRDDAGKLRPVPPQIAETRLITPREHRLQRLRETISEFIENIHPYNNAYLEHLDAQPTEVGITLVTTVEEIRRKLIDMTRECQHEVVTMHPGGGRPPNLLAEARDRDVAMLKRGVTMRVLYQHTSRTSLATKSYVHALTSAGGMVRTTTEMFARLIIFDRQIAFFSEPGESSGPSGAVIVTEPRVVSFLYRYYNHAWNTAYPFTAADNFPATAANGLQASILDCLALGLTDEVIARRLGMSVRTCRRHIAELLTMLNSTSRFQAGVEAARRGLIPAPPGQAGNGTAASTVRR